MRFALTNRALLWVSALPLLAALVFASAAVSGGNSDTKEKWEYKYYLPATNVCDNSNNALIDGLNKLGADGWELISFNPAGAESRVSVADFDQNNARTSLGQSVAQRAVVQSKVTACPLLLKRRVKEGTSAPASH